MPDAARRYANSSENAKKVLNESLHSPAEHAKHLDDLKQGARQRLKDDGIPENLWPDELKELPPPKPVTPIDAAGAAGRAAPSRIPRSITDTPEVKATFAHTGRGTFEDVNPTARNPVYRTDEAIPTGSTKGTRPYNNSTADMHAEIGAM